MPVCSMYNGRFYTNDNVTCNFLPNFSEINMENRTKKQHGLHSGETSLHTLTLLHSERPKLYKNLAFLSAIGLTATEWNLGGSKWTFSKARVDSVKSRHTENRELQYLQMN